MAKKLTEKKINTMLNKVWSGGFKLPRSYIRKARINDYLIKMDSYKYEKAKRKYQRKVFMTADGDVMSLRSLIVLVKTLIDMEK